MHLASILENKKVKRLATPEIAKKYISLGLNYHFPMVMECILGFNDEDYNNLGVNFINNEKEIIDNLI